MRDRGRAIWWPIVAQECAFRSKHPPAERYTQDIPGDVE